MSQTYLVLYWGSTGLYQFKNSREKKNKINAVVRDQDEQSVRSLQAQSRHHHSLWGGGIPRVSHVHQSGVKQSSFQSCEMVSSLLHIPVTSTIQGFIYNAIRWHSYCSPSWGKQLQSTSLIPRPTPFSVAQRTWRAWCPFSCGWCQGEERW